MRCFAVFKLCKYLITITGDARYGDWVERLAYNAIAATVPDVARRSGLLLLRLQCPGRRPSGTIQSAGPAARAPARWLWPTFTTSSTSTATDDLYVNLFVPSTVTWDRPGGPVTVRQRTRFPEADSTELTVAMQRPATFSLKLRIPAWLAGPLSIAVNGESVPAGAEVHGWAAVHREWRDGDRVAVRLPMKFDTRPLDSASPFPAILMRGPVALAVRSTGKNPGGLLRRPTWRMSSFRQQGAADLSHALGSRSTRPAVLRLQAG